MLVVGATACGVGQVLFAASILITAACGLWIWGTWSTEEAWRRAQKGNKVFFAGLGGTVVGLAVSAFYC